MAALNIINNELAGLSPGVKKQLDNQNYIDFKSEDHQQWAQQYMPDLYDEEVQIYGDRTLSGFLSRAGAEIPLQSDQVIWQEQNRLHIAYNKCAFDTGVSSSSSLTKTGLKLNVQNDQNAVSSSTPHAIRKHATVVIMDESTGVEAKAVVVSVLDESVNIAPYQAAFPSSFFDTVNPDLKVFIYGSEFDKGTFGMEGSVEPQVNTYTNSPIIMKDHYGINGTDTGQIGWVQVDTEDGTGGYLWYLKAKSETMIRWKDYLEMSMLESEKAADGAAAAAFFEKGTAGTEGFFAAIEDRGNIFGAEIESIGQFDTILKTLDTQGAISENMLYLNRTQNLNFDDMLGAIGDNGNGGSSFGVFSNSESMALNLGFDGFKRGGYEFYKTDWKYLNAPEARGASLNSTHKGGSINGVLIPAGSTNVYDKGLGSNVKRPFLHIRYRSSDVDNRLNKTWVTGSVGARTTSEDKMDIHFLTERMLCVQAANNFVLLK